MFKQMKLKNKLTVIQVIVMVIVVLAYFVIIQVFSYLYNNMVFGNVEHTLSLISDRVDQDIAFKREIAARVASDAYVQESMKDLAGSEEGYSQIKIINRLKSVINTYTSATSNIVGSLLIDSGAVTQVRTGEFDLPPEVSPEDLMREARKNSGGTRMLYFKTSPNTVYICCSVKQEGVYFIEVDMSSLLYFTVNVSENSKFKLIIADQGYPVYCDREMEKVNIEKLLSAQSKEYSFTEYDGNRYMMLVRQNATIGWEYIILEEYNMIFKGLNRTNIVFYLILVLTVISVSIIYVLLIKRTTLSLEMLAQKLHCSADKFLGGATEENKSNDEIFVMYEDLDKLVNQMQKMIRENYVKQLKIKETEYKMLQMQISPHFFYNTLQSVSVMAKMGLTEKIPDVIKKLSNLLRMSLDNKYMLHTVGEEIEILHDYVDIQLVRFGERLSFTVDDSVYEAEEYLIPKMTLQPLVENCICHVLEKVPAQCMIELKAEFAGETAKIMVLDNGYGISASRVKSILDGTFAGKHNSIGLYNVNERLKHYFGDEYGLKMYNLPQGGACVEVRIAKAYIAKDGDADEEGFDC